MIEQKIRIEIREEGRHHINKMCEGSLAQAIAFLQALKEEQKDEQDNQINDEAQP
jgi:DNA polymerase III delta prime subunit